MPSLVLVKTGCRNHSERINAAWQKGCESYFETGRALIDAKADLEHGLFEAMVQTELLFDPSTARRLMIIAGHPVISNRAHGHALPPSWRTLYELTKVPEPKLIEHIKDGTINPKMERRDVRVLLPPPQHSKKKRKRGKAHVVSHSTTTEHERDLEFLRSAWASACSTARKEFLREINGSIP